MALKYADVYELKEPSGEPSTFGTFFWIGLYAVGDAPCRYKWPDNSTMNFEARFCGDWATWKHGIG